MKTFINISKELIIHLPKKFQNFSDIGAHQIRIKCSNNFVGYPVPEGWHKDMCDYVAIITLNYKNIVGGTSRIRENLNDQNDIYNTFLKKNNFLLLNEKSFYHYTDPINIKNKNNKGLQRYTCSNNKWINILKIKFFITGGTGSFGKAFTKFLLENTQAKKL